MSKYMYNIPPEKAMEVAQMLAHRITAAYGVSIIQQGFSGGGQPALDLDQTIKKSTNRTQTIIDNIITREG